MAYSFNENAYYGDAETTIGRYSRYGRKQSGKDEPKPTPDPDPTPTPTPTPIDPSELTELDFSKITVVNAPWVGKQSLESAVSDIVASPKTLNQTIEMLEELVERLQDVATASQA